LAGVNTGIDVERVIAKAEADLYGMTNKKARATARIKAKADQRRLGKGFIPTLVAMRWGTRRRLALGEPSG